MRIVQLIVVLLLLLGFAARPTVATAVTDGHFLGPAMAASMLHQPHAQITVVTTLEHGVTPADPQCSQVKCVALGILPSAGANIPRQPTTLPTYHAVEIATFTLGYTQLRPPRSLAPLGA